MNHPQTYAEKIYKHFPTMKLKSIKDNACCAFTLMWCLGIDVDDTEAILTVSSMMDKRALDVDCTVYWTDAAKYLGKKIKVTFKDIDGKDGIKSIKARTPVKYSYNKKSHWVGVENGKVAFNPLEYSVCVDCGKPVTMRKLEILEG